MAVEIFLLNDWNGTCWHWHGPEATVASDHFREDRTAARSDLDRFFYENGYDFVREEGSIVWAEESARARGPVRTPQ